jgi:hypothetical protein
MAHAHLALGLVREAGGALGAAEAELVRAAGLLCS